MRTPGGSITRFEAPGAGTAPYQGTYAWTINNGGTSAGFYVDAYQAYHGFLVTP